MTVLLERAGASFLRAFAVAFLLYATGILNAPNVEAAKALSIAALFASLAAGFKAVQVFIPQLSWAGLLEQPYGAWLDSFTRAFLASFIVTITGWLSAPDLTTWKSVLLAAVLGAGAAGVRALQGVFTKGETPLVNSGVPLPNPAP